MIRKTLLAISLLLLVAMAVLLIRGHFRWDRIGYTATTWSAQLTADGCELTLWLKRGPNRVISLGPGGAAAVVNETTGWIIPTARKKPQGVWLRGLTASFSKIGRGYELHGSYWFVMLCLAIYPELVLLRWCRRYARRRSDYRERSIHRVWILLPAAVGAATAFLLSSYVVANLIHWRAPSLTHVIEGFMLIVFLTAIGVAAFHFRAVRDVLRFRFCPELVCLKCGYDLTGNVSGRCSECGAEVVTTEPNA